MASFEDTKFLVVDDMPSMRKIICKALSDLGAKSLEQAENGDDAWNKLLFALQDGKPYHFVVSDWTMPVLTGLELLKRFKMHPHYKNIPFILVTAEAEGAQVAEAVKSGVDAYIVKPVRKEMLQEKIMAVWTRRGEA